MTDEIYLSRRKVLGSLGVIGGASAAAGLGTTAFFSDRESFANNQLVAGSLDMKVGWEEHYSDWSEDELQGIPDANVTMTDEVRFSPTEVPGIEFNTAADLEQWKENTLVEQFPDKQTRKRLEAGDVDPCQVLADVPDDLERPVIDITDVKPGDEGEVTFTFHICDNPGYVWLNGRLIGESENGLTEPEADDPDEEPGRVELADEIRTVLWYDDDADNIYEPVAGDKDQELDCVMVLDTSANLDDDEFDEMIEATRGMVAGLKSVDTENNVAVGIVTTGGGATLEQDLTLDESRIVDDGNILDRIKADGKSGQNALREGIGQAHEELLRGDQYDTLPEDEDLGGVPGDPAESPGSPVTADGPRRGVPKIMIILNGSAQAVNHDTPNASAARDDGIQIMTVGVGDYPTDPLQRAQMKDLSTFTGNGFLAFIDTDTSLTTKLRTVTEVIGSEECFFRGSLRELLDLLSSSGPNDVAGIPLDGNRVTRFEEVTGTSTDGDSIPDEDFAPGSGDSTHRECFPPSRNHHLGFTWFLPLDHGNEVQTDSVRFDLGFYTEQCRHNDGSGMGNTEQALNR